MNILLKSFAIVISSLVLIACPQQTESNSPSSSKIYQATEKDINLLHQDIVNLISDKSCNASSDCELVALGARACGGPDSYEVYSKLNTDTEKLNALARQLEQLQKAYNQENQIMSICMVEPKPGFSCNQNQCQKQRISNLIQ